MFGDKKKNDAAGKDILDVSTGDTNKGRSSLTKMESRKERLAKFFKRNIEEEEEALYKPEMEFVGEEESEETWITQEEDSTEEAVEDINMEGTQEEDSTEETVEDIDMEGTQEEDSTEEAVEDIDTEEISEDISEEQDSTDKKQKTGRFFSGFRGMFHRRISKKEEYDSSEMESQEDSYGDEPILYDEEEVQGLRKLSKKKIGVVACVAVLLLGSIIYFLMMNLGGTVDGIAYVESVKDIMGYGSGSGMNNRYTGEVEPQASQEITLQSDLSVGECYVEVGSQVKTGDKLFSYNTDELQLAKDRAELEVETLKNENSQLEKDITSYRSDLNSASTREKIELQTEILTAQTTIKKNEYSIASANEEIENLNKNIKDATVTSEMDGVVQMINQTVGAGSGSSDDEEDYSYSDSGEDSVYMTVVAVGDYRIKGSISETNVWNLAEGDPVIVRSRVDENAQWTGIISSINTDETEDSEDSSDEMDYYEESSSGESASTYNFYVELDSDEGLMMGQHVLVEQDFGQDEEKEGIWLPSAYLYMEEENYYVWRANSRERLELHPVTVGEYDENLDEYEIVEGLSMDDLIASDTGSLQENMRTTTDINEAVSTEDEYYEEETSDDETYNEEEYYEDEFSDGEFYDESDGEYYYDESDEEYDEDVDLGGNVELIDEGFDPAEFE